MDATPKWGVQLLGHPFDLQDWADVLKQPFDPWVAQHEEVFVLRWSGFDGLETASEVQERAGFAVDQLNGAMWIHRKTRPIRFEGIVAFNPDGTRQTTMMLATAHFEGRSRMTATGAAIRSDGTTVAPPPPKASNVQEWAVLAESHELLADALVYFARAEWFDVYKAVECLEDWVGGEAKLLDLNWIERDDFKRLKRTANSFRHRRNAGRSPPAPMKQNEARQLLATLICKAFIQAKG